MFIGPSGELVSSGICVIASLLVEGKRLPLAPLYLGSLYTRLDQVQEQYKISFGLFPMNCFVDDVFLQCFLFEHFPSYAPVRSVLEVSSDEEHPFSPRVWGWSGGRHHKLLMDMLDKEDAFCFHPFTTFHYPGVDGLHLIYHEDKQDIRHHSNEGIEGVYDFRQLCPSPGVLPGDVITDSYSAVGALICPYVYRPERVCRQLG